MVNRNKNRGDELEREIVNLMRKHGFRCERTLERGARSDGSATWDIDLYVDGDTAMIGECKRKKSGFKFLYESLGDNDFLAVRQDRSDRLYVLPERVFLDLIKQIKINVDYINILP